MRGQTFSIYTTNLTAIRNCVSSSARSCSSCCFPLHSLTSQPWKLVEGKGTDGKKMHTWQLTSHLLLWLILMHVWSLEMVQMRFPWFWSLKRITSSSNGCNSCLGYFLWLYSSHPKPDITHSFLKTLCLSRALPWQKPKWQALVCPWCLHMWSTGTSTR